jgi:glycosyltransferase involved in cell wall biosynthesis
MIAFNLPRWLETITKKYGDNRNISPDDLCELQERVKRFESAQPLVSIVIPAWNEDERITKTIASLAFNDFDFGCELLVVNNNSTDNTQSVIDRIGVRSLFESTQGIAPARRRGLTDSKGKYHLCCDSDTCYPPTWIKYMVDNLRKHEADGVACVYGSYAFIPASGKSRLVMSIYEIFSNFIRRFNSKENETRYVMGFNFGFNREVAIQVNGFVMEKPRKFRNVFGSEDFVADSEDGLMAFLIKKAGFKILYLNHKNSRVWTSNRRIIIDGGLKKAVFLRLTKLFNRKLFLKRSRMKSTC